MRRVRSTLIARDEASVRAWLGQIGCAWNRSVGWMYFRTTGRNVMITTSLVRYAGSLILAGVAISSTGCAEGPPRPNGGPPPAAIDACSQKGLSQACSFEDRGNSIRGSCQERGQDWVCVPDRAPPGGRSAPGSGAMDTRGPTARAGDWGASGGQGGASTSGPPPTPPREALDACLGLVSGAPCAVVTAHGDSLDGSCGYHGEELACIPSDPGHRPLGVTAGGGRER